jgi:GT2 family glycosyltransferase
LHRTNCQSFDFEVVVVDNGSRDGSVQVIADELRAFERSHFIANEKNVGACRGRNQALEHLLQRSAQDRPDYILTLDNDTMVDPDVIAGLVQHAQTSRPEQVVFAPPLWFADNSRRRQANWWLDGWRLPVQLEADWRLADPYNKGKTVDGIATAAALFKSDAFDELGYFEERLFFGLEDTEWFRRARAKGYEILVVPVQGKVLHDCHQSLGGSDKGIFAAARVYYVLRNMVLMMTLFRTSHRLRLFDFIKLALHVARYGIQTLISANWMGFRAIWRGLFDGIRRRTGPLTDRQYDAETPKGERATPRRSGTGRAAGVYFSSVGVLTVLLTMLYTLTIDWSESNLFIAGLQTLVIGFLLWAVADVMVQIVFLVFMRVFRGPLKLDSVDMADGIPPEHRSVMAYMLRASHISECDEAFDNMFRSYMDNLDPNGNLSAVLVSASRTLSIVEHEIALRDEYRGRIRFILSSEADAFSRSVKGQEAQYGTGPRAEFWAACFRRWRQQGLSRSGLKHAIEHTIENVARQFKYLHRTSTTLKKAGQYQDLMVLCSRGGDRPFTYLEEKYGSLGRSPSKPLFGFCGNLEDDQGLSKEALHTAVGKLSLRGKLDIDELKQAGLTHGTEEDLSFRYTALLDADNRIPSGTMRSLVEIAAANPDRGFLQVGILVFSVETWHGLRELLAHRSESKMPEAMFRALGRFGAYGKGLAYNGAVIERFIGCPQAPVETLPINVLSHDTIEALYLNPAYVPNLQFYEESATNILSRQAQLVRWALGDLANAALLLPRSVGAALSVLRRIVLRTKALEVNHGFKLQRAPFSARYIAHLSTRPLLQSPLFLFWILIETYAQTMIVHTNPLLMKWHFYLIVLSLVLLPKLYAPTLLFAAGVRLWFSRNGAAAKKEWAQGLRQFIGVCVVIVTTPLNYMPDILLGPMRLSQAIKSFVAGNADWKVQAQVERETREISFLQSLRRTWRVPMVALGFLGILWWYGFGASLLFAAMLVTWVFYPVTAWLGAKPISSRVANGGFMQWLLQDFGAARL